MNTIDLERLCELFGDSPHLIDAVGLGDLLVSANADPHEGAEWLPYYKAALGVLMQAFGMLEATCQTAIDMASAAPVPTAKWQRLLHTRDKSLDLARLHLRPCGVGPDRTAAKAAESEALIDRTLGPARTAAGVSGERRGG